MKETVNDLLKSIFRSYSIGQAITPEVREKMKLVEKTLISYKDNSVYCKNTDCIYQRNRKCEISTIKKNELLSIDDDGQCLSFSDDENDLD